MLRAFAVLCLVMICNWAVAEEEPVVEKAKAEETKGEKMAIQDGRQVSFDYTLTVEGQVVDSSKERGPLTYTHGEGKIIPGLSRQMEGMQEGEEKIITVAPQEGYGEIDPQAFKEIPKTSLPQDVEPQVGMTLMMRTSSGTAFPVKISEVKPEAVVVDFNHPLAGKTLTFQVKITSIK